MIESKFMGREIIKRPACPFCGLLIERPKEPDSRRSGEMPVGICSCGAVYACDETGHNIGSAIVEALVFGSNMDWDLAWSLEPDEDFRQEIVDHYDYVKHLIIPGGFFETRRISGVLVFIRFHEEVQEVTEEGVRKRLQHAGPARSDSSPYRRGERTLTKAEIERLVQEFRLQPLTEAAAEDKRIINRIQRLLYSGDRLMRMRAAEALGAVSAVVAERDPGAVSKLLQNLLYAVTDTAASSWGAFEAVGEIIRRRMELFAGYIPQLYQYLSDKERRVPVLQVLAKTAEVKPDLLRKITFYVLPLLKDPDPQVRGYAAWLMGNLRAKEVKDDLENMKEDPEGVEVYKDGELHSKSVGKLASEALEKLRKHGLEEGR